MDELGLRRRLPGNIQETQSCEEGIVSEVEPMPVGRCHEHDRQWAQLQRPPRLFPIYQPDENVVFEPELHLHVPAASGLRRALHDLEFVNVHSADRIKFFCRFLCFCAIAHA